jgi:hypothetical protein
MCDVLFRLIHHPLAPIIETFVYKLGHSLIVVLANIGDIIAYRHGLHSCKEVYPYRNR